MSTSPSSPLKVGVLLCSSGVQLLDLAAIDLLAMCHPAYLRSSGLPDQVVAMGREIEIRYIVDVVKGEAGEAPTEVMTTALARVRVTDTLDSIDINTLDILFIPGPDPSYHPSPSTTSFLQKLASSPHTLAILIVCSGVLLAAFSGILSSKRATAPLGMLPLLRAEVPDVQWVVKRWAVDESSPGSAKIWTSGGVTNGEDMLAAFLRESGGAIGVRPELAKLVCAIADVGGRGEDYPEWQLNMKIF